MFGSSSSSRKRSASPKSSVTSDIPLARTSSLPFPVRTVTNGLPLPRTLSKTENSFTSKQKLPDQNRSHNAYHDFHTFYLSHKMNFSSLRMQLASLDRSSTSSALYHTIRKFASPVEITPQSGAPVSGGMVRDTSFSNNFIQTLKIIEVLSSELEKFYKFCLLENEKLSASAESNLKNLAPLSPLLLKCKKSPQKVRSVILTHQKHVEMVKSLLPCIFDQQGLNASYAATSAGATHQQNKRSSMIHAPSHQSMFSKLDAKKKSHRLSVPSLQLTSTPYLSSSSSEDEHSPKISSPRSPHSPIEELSAQLTSRNDAYRSLHELLMKRALKASKKIDNNDLRTALIGLVWIHQDLFTFGSFIEQNFHELNNLLEEIASDSSFSTSPEYQSILSLVKSRRASCYAFFKTILKSLDNGVTSLYPNVDDYLCPICFCVLLHPTELPCQHKFCRKCLKDYNASLPNATSYFQHANEMDPAYVSPFLPTSKTPPPIRKQPCPICRRVHYISNINPPKEDVKLDEFIQRYFPEEAKEQRRMEKSNFVKSELVKRLSGIMKGAGDASILWGGTAIGRRASHNVNVGN